MLIINILCNYFIKYCCWNDVFFVGTCILSVGTPFSVGTVKTCFQQDIFNQFAKIQIFSVSVGTLERWSRKITFLKTKIIFL